MSAYPKDLVISLQHPARILLADVPLDLTTKQVTIAGSRVAGNDTPWCALADLLIDSTTRELVGLTYYVAYEWDRAPAKCLSTRLDPQVVRYNDMSTSELRRPYPGITGEEHWFEVMWKPTKNVQMELAQLMCGQWFWWYALEGEWETSRPVIALSLSDVDWTVTNHNLTFPAQIDLPPLEVRCE